MLQVVHVTPRNGPRVMLARDLPEYKEKSWESFMQKSKQAGNGGLESPAEPVETPETETIEPAGEDRGDVVATVATVAVVGVAAAAFEAALLPGIALGVAAVVVPRYLPQLGSALNPLFRSTVRGAYKIGQKTREMVAEAQEQMHDIVAEVHAEGDAATSATKGTGPSGTPG